MTTPPDYDALAKQAGAITGSAPVDYDALAQQAIAQAPPDPAPAPTPSHWYDSIVQAGSDYNDGVKKGLNETGLTAMKMIHATPVVGDALSKYTKFDQSMADTQKIADAPTKGLAGAAGYGVENILEFMAGDEALKGLSLGEKMAKIAPVLKTLEKYPRVAQALHAGIRQGVVGGAQAAVHGQDAGDSTKTGVETAATGAVLHGAGSALTDVINSIRPTTRTIGKEIIPILASQEKNAAPMAVSAATIGDEPAMMQSQQAAGQRVVKNTAQDATKAALDRVNSARVPPPAPEAITDPAKLRAAPEDMKPYQFSIPTPGPEGVAGEEVGGKGVHIVDDPSIAQLHLSRLEALQESPAFSSLPASQQAEVNNAATSLNKQFDDFNAYRSTNPNFKPVDASAAVSQVGSFGEAADQVEAAVKPIYQKLDEVSEGEFSALRNQRKNALKVLRQPGSIDAADDASSKLDEANTGLDKLFTKAKGSVSEGEYNSAKAAWRDAKVLDSVHAAVEGAFNHLPENIANSSPDLSREIRGKVLQQRLGSVLKKLPQEEVERVIGSDGLRNLYRVSNLLSTPSRSAVTYNAATSIAKALAKKTTGAVLGGAAGAMLGHAYEGAGAGIAAEQGARYVLRAAAVHPEVGRMLDYGVRHNLNSKLFVPAMAAAIQNLNHQDPAPPVEAAPYESK